MHKFPQNYPQAEKIPHTHVKHGDARLDNYFWLRDRENPKVASYLEAENAYTAEVMRPVAELEKKVFNELKSRIKEDDSSVPFKKGDYYYYARYEAGQQYPIHARKRESLSGAEEILINQNELAKGFQYFDGTPPVISPNQEWMIYGVDTVGRRFYKLYIKNLKTGKVLSETIDKVVGNVTWAADNKTIFYSQQHPDTLRAERIYRYNIETKKQDLVFHEKDETYRCFVYTSLSKKYVYIISQSTLTTEVRFVPADKPEENFRIFTPRQEGHEYSVHDDGKRFFILTNLHARNFKLVTAELAQTDIKNWKDLIPHRQDVYLEDITVFKNYIALSERKDGLSRLTIVDLQAKNPYVIPFPDQSYLASEGDNAEFDTEIFRYEYESMRLPESTYDLNMKTHALELKRTKEVPNYNPDLYRTERIFIPARDGTQVPVSLLMKKDHKNTAQAPLLVYGYGSYSANMDPWFSPSVFSLVDRGFVYAKAHIRGGGEMGRDWYDQGRTLSKMNTFYDFIDATEYLVKKKYAHPEKVFAMGGSAGGLLMGAVMNLRPDLYRGVVAQVPFVDVISTMLDESIPLTTNEYDEWGNPNDKKFYDYIKSYSPYDNVRRQAYPNTLITTGFHDSQVQYWEPAKWTAKLREYKTNDAVILLKTDMTSGHGGASGRFEQLKEIATEFAFILMLL